jgi:hypothetical protein
MSAFMDKPPHIIRRPYRYGWAWFNTHSNKFLFEEKTQ